MAETSHKATATCLVAEQSHNTRAAINRRFDKRVQLPFDIRGRRAEPLSRKLRGTGNNT